VTRTSPLSNFAAGPFPGAVQLRIAFSLAVLVLFGLPTPGAAQEMSAFPETPRAVRRIDSAAPVSLSETATGGPSVLTADTGKTLIRRLGDASNGNADRPRSQWMVWVVLVGIVGSAAGLSFWARRGGGPSHWKIPNTVFQVLGRSAVSPNQSVTLLRLGERVLLVSSSGATMQTLAVVTDPVEVATITSECLSKRSAQIAELTPPPTRRATVKHVPETQAVAGTIGAERSVRTPRPAGSEVGNA